MAKKVKKNNYSMIIGLICVAVFAVVVSVGAASDSKVFQNIENYYEAQSNEVVLGAAQSDIATGFYDVYVENDLTVDGQLLSDAALNFTLDFTAVTGTTGLALPVTQTFLGSVENETGVTLMCTASLADITATGIYGYDLSVGVATTATSSVTLISADAVATSTDEIAQQSTPGTAFEVADGSFITAISTIDAANATSSASFTVAGGNAGAGTVYVNCVTE